MVMRSRLVDFTVIMTEKSQVNLPKTPEVNRSAGMLQYAMQCKRQSMVNGA